jgi:hypothetical protein
MICHRRKIIFIHIPKCAGSSVKDFYFAGRGLDWKVPNYELLYGYCPVRRLHLQHATARELLETGLVTEQQWNAYFKFTFVRNVYDRSYSDYLWIQKDRKVSGPFLDYLLRRGRFEKILTDRSDMTYRGDHLTPQSDFFDLEGPLKVDFVGRFESIQNDTAHLSRILGIDKPFDVHEKRNASRKKHYSQFFSPRERAMVEQVYAKDLATLGYQFESVPGPIRRMLAVAGIRF